MAFSIADFASAALSCCHKAHPSLPQARGSPGASSVARRSFDSASGHCVACINVAHEIGAESAGYGQQHEGESPHELSL